MAASDQCLSGVYIDSVCPCRPIDLSTIKKNIELGATRTTAEFQRDVMLMFLNSIMYNKTSHFVHKMARQMQQEGMQHVQVSHCHPLLI
jgi:bromodomain-containing protein 8